MQYNKLEEPYTIQRIHAHCMENAAKMTQEGHETNDTELQAHYEGKVDTYYYIVHLLEQHMRTQ